MLETKIQRLGIGSLVTHKETLEGLNLTLGEPFGNRLFETLGMTRTPTANAHWHSSQILRLNWGRGMMDYL